MGFFVGVERALAQRDQNMLEQQKINLMKEEKRKKKFGDISSFLDNFGGNYNSSSDSKDTSKEKAGILLELEDQLGVDSEIYTQLAGGSIEDLKNAKTIIMDAKERFIKAGNTFTKEDAIESFDLFRTEVIEKQNPITVEQVLGRWGFAEDPDAVIPGYEMTVTEAAERFADIYNQPTQIFGMTPKIEPDDVTIDDFNTYMKTYKDQALDILINAERKAVRENNPNLAFIYKDAADDVKEGSFASFKSLVPNLASQFATEVVNEYPVLKNNNLFLNSLSRGLTFTNDDAGNLALIDAIKSKLLRKGSVWSAVEIQQDGTIKVLSTNTLSQDDIDRAMNQ
tara:strand:+ start:2337 stop:3353 length:1017 start_codon:yes stop_codon:yes gene_type:complete